MKRRHVILIGVICALAAAAAIYCFLPRTFLKGVDPAKIASIEVKNGSTGKTLVIDEKEDIAYIVGNIQSIRMKKDKRSLGYMGYGYRLRVIDVKGKTVSEFIINSDEMIRKDPFFYMCEGRLCYEYITQLFERENSLGE